LWLRPIQRGETFTTAANETQMSALGAEDADDIVDNITAIDESVSVLKAQRVKRVDDLFVLGSTWFIDAEVLFWHAPYISLKSALNLL
jgi:hypothetical protein